MKTNFKVSFLLFILFLTSCSEDDSRIFEEENQEYKIVNNIQYKVVSIDSNQSICNQIANLTNNSYLEFNFGQTEIISCDILIEGKSNIIIDGNNSYLKYEDPSRIGFKIKVINSQNIVVENFNIDNNNTKPHYILDPTNTSVSGRIEVIESSSIEFNSVNLNKQQVFGSSHGTVTQILFKETTDSSIKNCKMEYADGELIYLLASKNCLVTNNFLNEGTSGIATAGYNQSGVNKIGYNNKIISNTVVNSSTAFITINDRNALVEGNYIYNDDDSKKHGPGIRFGHEQEYLHASNASCKNNIIKNLKYPNGNYNPVGIKVDYTQTSESKQIFTDLIIEGNEIINCQGGIKVSNQSGQYMLIKDNQISSTTRFAIELFSADPNGQQTKPQYCLISNNILSSENGVIKIHNSTTTLSDNHISSNSIDPHNINILIGSVYDSGNFPNEIKLKNNILELNGDNGIYYNGNNLKNALILDNIISNGNLGIYLGGKENLIKHNVIRNCTNRSIYIRSGSINTTISNNDIYNNFENSVYLHNTIGTSVLNNKFNFTGTNEYPWAVWKNSTSTNLNSTIRDNTLNNFTNENN
ncbi:right-handed parallel beta-helix repeat-containing protein [Aquimarina sp. RZ0]|uniref:right-handed parallel beta-helix repeat-containing protein n=1 Tax=Aquimarina sp. RZ0 TaxID=2607730 RepID=UPI0011F3B2A7|nr:right-handed parallel beta-helix repeat-containing protein [Aquimarina sp. RZ0]KAA1240778.1 right-handed parallel beta-helix repeat-containing protein [Aquimarina sp. RZ0]